MRRFVSFSLLLFAFWILISSSIVLGQENESLPTPPHQEFSPPVINPNEPVFPMDSLIKEPLKQNDRFFSEFLNMLATLGFIIAVILMVAWFLKRMVNTRMEQANVSSSIKVLERRAISPKSMLYLVELEGTGFLIAESVNGITRLSEFPIAAESETPPQPKQDFSKILENKPK